MSNVVKSKRKTSQFEASHHLIKLRDDITKLCINDFGFSVDKCKERRDKYEVAVSHLSNKDEIMRRYDKKMDSFDTMFVDKECDVVLDLLRNIVEEFTYGNSIYPSNNIALLAEYIERRKHITKAISVCYILRNELNYIARILPVDLNRYKNISENIEKQILLFKGVRQSDNRFLKSINNDEVNVNDMLSYLIGDILLQ